jgi:hypothetical protein
LAFTPTRQGDPNIKGMKNASLSQINVIQKMDQKNTESEVSKAPCFDID